MCLWLPAPALSIYQRLCFLSLSLRLQPSAAPRDVDPGLDEPAMNREPLHHPGQLSPDPHVDISGGTKSLALHPRTFLPQANPEGHQSNGSEFAAPENHLGSSHLPCFQGEGHKSPLAPPHPLLCLTCAAFLIDYTCQLSVISAVFKPTSLSGAMPECCAHLQPVPAIFPAF